MRKGRMGRKRGEGKKVASWLMGGWTPLTTTTHFKWGMQGCEPSYLVSYTDTVWF